MPYTPNVLNQYTGINGQTLSYASNGTLTADPTAPLGAASYGWDMFNRLVSVKNSQHVASYTYDTKGNRSQKVVDGSTQNFAYDGSRIIMQYGPTALPNSAQERWIYGVGNAPFVQEALSSDAVSNRFFIHPDAIGTTLVVSGNAGNLNGPGYPTSPWGETSNGGGIPFRFAGMWLDGESMLYYDHARYYSPAQGRFISPDPIGIKGGINIYAYAGNDPVNSVDVTGLDEDPFCIGSCGGGGGGGSSGGFAPSFGDPGGMFAPGDAYYGGIDAAQGNEGYSVSSTGSAFDPNSGDSAESYTWKANRPGLPTYSETEITSGSDYPGVENFPPIAAGQVWVYGSAPPGVADPFAGQAYTPAQQAYLPGWGANDLTNSVLWFEGGSIAGGGGAALLAEIPFAELWQDVSGAGRFFRGPLRQQVQGESPTCVYCGDPASQVDHVIPFSRGGPTSFENAANTCAPCNLSKGAKLLSEWGGRTGFPR